MNWNSNTFNCSKCNFNLKVKLWINFKIKFKDHICLAVYSLGYSADRNKNVCFQILFVALVSILKFHFWQFLKWHWPISVDTTCAVAKRCEQSFKHIDGIAFCAYTVMLFQICAFYLP